MYVTLCYVMYVIVYINKPEAANTV